MICFCVFDLLRAGDAELCCRSSIVDDSDDRQCDAARHFADDAHNAQQNDLFVHLEKPFQHGNDVFDFCKQCFTVCWRSGFESAIPNGMPAFSEDRRKRGKERETFRRFLSLPIVVDFVAAVNKDWVLMAFCVKLVTGCSEVLFEQSQ